MRWNPLLLLAALGSCSDSVDTFQVYDPQGRVRAAHVQVCGSETPMLQHGKYFFAGVPINCEGSGHIRLVYRDGNKTECAIGYVTGMSQNWYFRAESASCEPRRLHG
ncbi:hypothetical protein [Altererythrobacter sp. Root672]|uniref:hypothetical protein n=1 Tax=Altererythrobacter sp. Root672 TaxID=1736584 RepID=UPI0006F54EFA|nr:hypothetical protein [Altererythrobacter sp. Root672]KRA82823.1 hypothetical protein ASD76_01655 [Altererythrobacter sp. Root672]